MSYLEKIVGLTGTTPPPLAGVRLVNDLPIISESFVTGSSKHDDTDPINDVWKRIIKTGESELEVDVYTEAMKDVRFRQLVSITQECYTSTGNRLASERLEGARIRADKSPYCKLTIDGIYLSGTGIFDVYIYDLITGEELFELENQELDGEGQINIGFSISLGKLKNDIAIGIDCTGIDLEAIDGNRGFLSDNCAGIGIEVFSGYINNAQEKKATNFTQSSSFVHVIAKVEIDSSLVISKNISIFKDAAWYLCGYMLLNESLTTDKFNWWTNTNRAVRETESIRQEQKYKEYIKKAMQPLFLHLFPTPVIQDKSVEEKQAGIYKGDLAERCFSRYELLDNRDIPYYY